MEYREFVHFAKRLKFYFSLGGPDISDEAAMMAWYEALKHIPAENFKAACITARDSMHQFPLISDFLKMTGFEVLTMEKEAEKAACRLLEVHKCGRAEEKAFLGPLAFQLCSEIGGTWDIRQMNLHDPSTYNTQKKRLTLIAMDILKKAQCGGHPSTTSLGEAELNGNNLPQPRKEDHIKAPLNPNISNLISDLKKGARID